jgi:hypothetical protein
MTYRELFYKATRLINNNKITLGEYEEMTKPLDREVEQEPRWISVSEDAPPKETICLWCNKQGSVFTSAITYRSENNSYVGKHGYFSNGLENHGDIVAWMPLPLPYEPQESEETDT